MEPGPLGILDIVGFKFHNIKDAHPSYEGVVYPVFLLGLGFELMAVGRLTFPRL